MTLLEKNDFWQVNVSYSKNSKLSAEFDCSANILITKDDLVNWNKQKSNLIEC